ncbi:MAG: FAD:protein FMN transferase [Clostridia bacterium]|nr:FAD:protein FMN transferase [Clostridia bacterium]
MKRTSFLIMLIVISFFLGSCGIYKKTRYEAEFLFLFDTATTVIGYTRNEEEFRKETQLLYDQLEEYHQLYDIYNEYEGLVNIKTINQNAGIAPVTVDSRIIDLLLFSKEAYRITQGKLNVAFGAVLKIWHTYRTNGIEDPFAASLPSVQELALAAEHININDIIIDKEASTVFLRDKAMSLDVGAIAKGYAVEQVGQYLKQQGYTDFLINVGGNVKAIGYKGDEKTPWKVGIQNPDKTASENIIMNVTLHENSLVSSGDYLRYYTVNGLEYHHIIDPETLFPSEYFDSVTIISSDSGFADALSTAIFNMPFEEGISLIEGLDDTEALWIFEDGSQKESTGFIKAVD